MWIRCWLLESRFAANLQNQMGWLGKCIAKDLAANNTLNLSKQRPTQDSFHVKNQNSSGTSGRRCLIWRLGDNDRIRKCWTGGTLSIVLVVCQLCITMKEMRGAHFAILKSPQNQSGKGESGLKNKYDPRNIWKCLCRRFRVYRPFRTDSSKILLQPDTLFERFNWDTNAWMVWSDDCVT